MLVMLSTIIRIVITEKPGGFSRLFNAYCDEIAAYFSRRAVITSLRELDNRALRDVGLDRSQIVAAVHGFVIIRDRERM